MCAVVLEVKKEDKILFPEKNLVRAWFLQAAEGP
jgi:hypothetical protein